MTREQACELIHERLYKLETHWLYFIVALIMDKEEEEKKRMTNINEVKAEQLKELIGLNLEPLQYDDYRFLKAINNIIIEYVNANYSEG